MRKVSKRSITKINSKEVPLITIGITCFNAEKTIDFALRSAFLQDWSNFEIIVVDDGSTDNSIEILKKWKAKDNNLRIFYNKTNQGCAYSRNSIIKKAKGLFIAFFDDDDFSRFDRIRLQYQKLTEYEKSEQVKLVACFASGKRVYKNGYTLNIKAVGTDGIVPIGIQMADYLLFFKRIPKIAYGGGVPTYSLFIRTSTLKNLKGFDIKMRRQEDVDLGVRLAMKNAHFIGIIEPVITQYATESNDKTALIEYESSLRLIKKYYNYLEPKGLYRYMKLWLKMKYFHFISKEYLAFLILIKIFLIFPIRTIKHFSRSALNRFIHEKLMSLKSKNLNSLNKCVKFLNHLIY